MKKRALFAGSFDPFTNGHCYILENSLKLFDEMTILIANNNEKKPIWNLQTRQKIVNEVIQNNENWQNKVQVAVLEQGLTVDYCRNNDIKFMIRGVRWIQDMENEMNLVYANNTLAPDILTIIIFINSDKNLISSRMVKSIYLNQGDITNFVPSPVLKYLNKNET